MTNTQQPPPLRSEAAGDIAMLRDVTAAAAELLTAAPRRAAALTYLRQRGIDPAGIPADWPLGYAPPGWTRLVDALRRQFPDEALEAAGVARRSSRGTLIDIFRDRVIFPMRRPDGQVVGFTGRDLSGASNAPKYLNSPRSVQFDKSSLLYGLAERRAVGVEPESVVLVEGPLDVLAIVSHAHREAIPAISAVATCGTAFTIAHARQIARLGLGQPIVIAMDGDSAGRSAASTAGELLRQGGLDARIALLPNGLDPVDHLMRGGSLKEFAPAAALPLLTVHVERAIAAQGDRMQWIEGRLAASRSIASYLATYPAEQAARHIAWISGAVQVPVETFTRELVHAFRAEPRSASGPTFVNRGPAFTRPVSL